MLPFLACLLSPSFFPFRPFPSLALPILQGLLYYGLQRSSERADKDHPYGYGFETYVWCMISAVGSFFLGAGASVYHGTTVSDVWELYCAV